MTHQLHFVILIVMALKTASAVDPFSGGLPTLSCDEDRKITGCNETFLDAYKRTKAAESDNTINEPTTRFWLYTRRNRKNPEPLHNCGGYLPSNSYYSKTQRTIIMVPGHRLNVCDHAMMRETKDQLLYKGNYNVILLDWSWGNLIDYYVSNMNVPVVARQTAFLLKNILIQTETTTDNLYLIGHYNGAHIVGLIGKLLKADIGQVYRITALDPALSTYNVDDPSKRLNKADAKWVDVLHTNAGDCLPYYGLNVSLGHADFYPSGGSVQFSCFPKILESYLKLDLVYATYSLDAVFCFNHQSLEYFKTSINACDKQFIAVECQSYSDFKSKNCNSCGEDGSKCSIFGIDWDRLPGKKRRGEHKFYFDTTLTCPYVDNSGINVQGFQKILTEIKRSGEICFDPNKKP